MVLILKVRNKNLPYNLDFHFHSQVDHIVIFQKTEIRTHINTLINMILHKYSSQRSKFLNIIFA